MARYFAEQTPSCYTITMKATMDGAMETEFIYRIDSRNHVVFVNEPWLRFAEANMQGPVSTDRFLNRSLFDFISGAETKHLYDILLQRIREGDFSVTLPFRCDSPALKRYMTMTISKQTDGEVPP